MELYNLCYDDSQWRKSRALHGKIVEGKLLQEKSLADYEQF